MLKLIGIDYMIFMICVCEGEILLFYKICLLIHGMHGILLVFCLSFGLLTVQLILKTPIFGMLNNGGLFCPYHLSQWKW
jgi:hypothetical protein